MHTHSAAPRQLPQFAVPVVAVLALLILQACAESGPTAPTPDAPQLVEGAAAFVAINEIMADPSRATDADGEWLELYNWGTGPIDVAGWSIVSNDGAHAIAGSLVIPAGGYVVLGRSTNTKRNGGAPVQYAYGSAITLANAGDWLALRDASGAGVDSVTWTSSSPGVARGVINAGADNTAVDGSNWQDATSTFGGGRTETRDYGTPGLQNDAWVAPGPGDPGTPGDTTGPGDPPTDTAALVVKVLDVGQGDATYIENGGSVVFIDGGPSTVDFGAHLDALGLNGDTVDVVVISHAHFDHYSGLRELFEDARGITVRYVFENRDAGTAVSLAQLRDSIDAAVGRGETIVRDTDNPCGDGSAVCTITLRGGARLHVMKPDPGASDPNNRSTPVKLVGPDSASFTMWFAGDAEHEAIGWFDTGADYDGPGGPGMDVDVLKGDHHGSCNGVTSRYLDLLSPEWVTFGVSATNSYGHVHGQTKDLLRSRGIPWYRTDENGSITFTSPGTPGGGYVASVEQGSASLDGAADGYSASSLCDNL